MLDLHSQKVLSNFLEPFLDVEPDGRDANGLMNDIAIKQGLSALVKSEIYSPEQLTVKLAQVEGVAFPACRLKEFMESGKWTHYIEVG